MKACCCSLPATHGPDVCRGCSHNSSVGMPNYWWNTGDTKVTIPTPTVTTTHTTKSKLEIMEALSDSLDGAVPLDELTEILEEIREFLDE